MAIPSIGDNINETLKEFTFEEFGTMNELAEYMGSFFAIEDLVGGLEGALDFVEPYKNVIFQLLDEILKIFDLNDMFTDPNVGSLADTIMNSITNGKGVGHITDKSALMTLGEKFCNKSNIKRHLGTDDALSAILNRFTLVSVLSAMSCAKGTSAFSSMINTMYDDSAIDTRVPEPIYLDSNGFMTDEVTNTILNSKEINEVMAENVIKADRRSDVDKLFASIVPPALSIATITGNSSIIMDVTEGNIPALVREYTPNITSMALDALGKVDNLGRQPTNTLSAALNGIKRFDGISSFETKMITGKHEIKERIRNVYKTRVPDISTILDDPDGILLNASKDMF